MILPYERHQRSSVLEFSPPGSVRVAEARLAEAVGLTASIGVTIVHTGIHPLRERRPSTLMGEGQVASVKQALAEQGAEDVMVVVGGVIPPDDVPTLLEAGAAEVFLPGTVIAEAALGLLEKLSAQLGH